MGVKLQDIQRELSLSDRELGQFLRLADIRVPENVKRISDKETKRLRSVVSETRRREQKKQEVIAIPPLITIRELADRMELQSGEIIKQLLKNGMVVNVNEEIDYETAAIIASDLGYTTKEDTSKLEEDIITPEKLSEILEKEDPTTLQSRPPVVTIMGHIDHGKTSLLDAIRTTSVAKAEAGGITQRISSYQAKKNGKIITFIDTPGHEVFEFMRQRGASLADIGILVVAADDGVMAQTKEAVRHAKRADIPILVAITKTDLQSADPDKVKRQLAEVELLPEEYGGDVPVVLVSSTTKEGIPDLLETILLMTQVSEPKANPQRPALATVIEARHDSKSGVLASVLVHTGTLKQHDPVVVGRAAGIVRQLLDFNGKIIREASPSTPCTIIGIGEVPNAGDILQVVEERTVARKKAAMARVTTLQNKVAARTLKTRPAPKDTQKEETDSKDNKKVYLSLVLNADAQGSLQAIQQTVQAMGTNTIAPRFLRTSVGNITENDVMAAEAAGGTILGFNVGVSGAVSRLAEKNSVPIHRYSVIYELTKDVREWLEGIIPTEVVREDIGEIKVIKVFFKIRGRQIIGGMVTRGAVRPDEKLEVRRGNEIVARGTVTEVQQNRTVVKEAEAGSECGITYEGEGRIREGDVVTIYHEETQKRKLEDT